MIKLTREGMVPYKFGQWNFLLRHSYGNFSPKEHFFTFVFLGVLIINITKSLA
jgi:hypothetical protein